MGCGVGPGGRDTAALMAAVTAGVVAASWLARRAVERGLEYGQPVRIVGEYFRLTSGENTGLAFGMLRDSPLATWLPLIALVAILGVLRGVARRCRPGAVAAGLVLGGGLANLIDRLADGRVTDYLDWGIGDWRYATFNFPDTMLIIGIGLLAWLSVRSPR